LPGLRRAIGNELSDRQSARRTGPIRRRRLPFEKDGYQVRYRLPNSLDLLAANGSGAETGRRVLIERCVLAPPPGRAFASRWSPTAVIAQVIEQIARMTPGRGSAEPDLPGLRAYLDGPV
jgi:hypothetical protein